MSVMKKERKAYVTVTRKSEWNEGAWIRSM